MSYTTKTNNNSETSIQIFTMENRFCFETKVKIWCFKRRKYINNSEYTIFNQYYNIDK